MIYYSTIGQLSYLGEISVLELLNETAPRTVNQFTKGLQVNENRIICLKVQWCSKSSLKFTNILSAKYDLATTSEI